VRSSIRLPLAALTVVASSLVPGRGSRRRRAGGPPGEREVEADLHRVVIENTSDLLALARAGRVDWISPSVERAFGYGAGDLRNGFVSSLVHPDDVERVHAAWRLAVSGESTSGTCRVRAHDGSWKHLEGTLTPLPDGRVLVVARDATKRVDSERRRRAFDLQIGQAQKMEAIGHLAAGVGHDFNNVLLAVRGYAELIAWDAEPSSRVRSFVDEIVGTCERATGLTRQLLALGRRQAMVPELLDLNGVVRDTRRLLDPLLGEGVELELRLADGLSPLRADRGQLEQSIVWLTLNANSAMPEGGTLTISTAAEWVDRRGALTFANVLPGEYVRLDVRDTGLELDAEAQTRIFEPFFSTGTREGGLGLSAVYGFVTQSGGHIAVQNAQEGGTCFSVFLPVASRAYAAANGTAQTALDEP
jgi:PAS domain S-box-containing protein